MVCFSCPRTKPLAIVTIFQHFVASTGSYTVNLPDGRVQTVTYTADEYGGFVADVKYEGEPVYPPEPAEGYGNSYKSKYLPKHSA